MPDLKAFVANCLIGGDEITRNGENWTRDLIIFNCDEFTFAFRQKYDVAVGKIDKIKHTFSETSEVIIRDVEKGDIEAVRKALDRICWLLSFVTLSRVICYGYEYPDGSGLAHFYSVTGTANYFRPVLEIHDGKAVKNFVEQTYDTYRNLEKKRKLNVVIDFLLQAERHPQPTEVRLLLAFVTLENLKDTFAKSKSIPYIKGYFRKPASKPGKLGAQYSFEELLQIMLKEVRMKRGLKRAIQLRNEIIHSGLSRKPHARSWKMYEQMHDLIREYIIRLLGYHGRYLTYASAGHEAISI